MLVHGNHGIALGALAAGMRFYSAYPMTPSTSIMSYLSKKAKSAKVIVEQAEDEIAAIHMAIGASYTGVRAMTGTSGGGFSLMVEALGFAGIAEIPVVIALIQRPGPATGLPTRTEQSDLNYAINASHGEFGRMVIALRNPEDAFYQTARAFNLADKYQMPVILLGDQYLADAIQTVRAFDLDKIKIERHLTEPKPFLEGREYHRYELTQSGISPRLLPGRVPGTAVNVDSDEHDVHGNITEAADVRNSMVEKRARKFERLKREVVEPELLGEDSMDILLLGWGSTYSQLSEAVDILNQNSKRKYGALVFGDIWPFPQTTLIEKARIVKKIINVEQNHDGQLARLVREVTGIQMDGSVLRYDGRPLSPAEIARKVKEI
jgi:2-oxoglutarate ferredoxin oxidoreductase subunit alpha